MLPRLALPRLDSPHLDSTRLKLSLTRLHSNRVISASLIQRESTPPNLSNLKPYSWIVFVQNLFASTIMFDQSYILSERRRRSDTSGILQHESSMLVLVVGHQSLSNLHLVCLYLVLHYLLKQNKNKTTTWPAKLRLLPPFWLPHCSQGAPCFFLLYLDLEAFVTAKSSSAAAAILSTQGWWNHPPPLNSSSLLLFLFPIPKFS